MLCQSPSRHASTKTKSCSAFNSRITGCSSREPNSSWTSSSFVSTCPSLDAPAFLTLVAAYDVFKLKRAKRSAQAFAGLASAFLRSVHFRPAGVLHRLMGATALQNCKTHTRRLCSRHRSIDRRPTFVCYDATHGYPTPMPSPFLCSCALALQVINTFCAQVCHG